MVYEFDNTHFICYWILKWKPQAYFNENGGVVWGKNRDVFFFFMYILFVTFIV